MASTLSQDRTEERKSAESLEELPLERITVESFALKSNTIGGVGEGLQKPRFYHLHTCPQVILAIS